MALVFHFWNARWRTYSESFKARCIFWRPSHRKMDARSSRAISRLRDYTRKWLHERPWCLRDKSALFKVSGRDCNFHCSRGTCSYCFSSAGSFSLKKNSVAFVVGIIFAIGLGISGMTSPEKVFGFLDFFGRWDASLVFVMIGAVLVHLTAYRFIVRCKSPLFSSQWHLPTKKEITLPLISGSFLFGVGWGLAGYCPGPALVSLASFQSRPMIFFVSMIFGMLLFRLTDRRLGIKR